MNRIQKQCESQEASAPAKRKNKLFKDLIQDDLEIFFNFEEFGEMHRIEGKEAPCILMTDSAGSTSTASDRDLTPTGIYGANISLYLKKEDRPFSYSAGKVLNVDGKEMKILKVAEESGVLIFSLLQNRGY